MLCSLASALRESSALPSALFPAISATDKLHFLKLGPYVFIHPILDLACFAPLPAFAPPEGAANKFPTFLCFPEPKFAAAFHAVFFPALLCVRTHASFMHYLRVHLHFSIY